MPDTSDPSSFIPSARSRVRRHPDATLMCHIGYVIDGLPYVTPTLFWREGERLYWHGSAASRMLRTQAAGIPVCVTVAHMDGLILARSAFRHSLNYRAVIAFGTAAMVENASEKEAGLNAFIERLYPGRTRIMRAILPQELAATALMSMEIEEASAKIREGDPLDLEADHAADCWAGMIPIAQRIGVPIPDPRGTPRTAPGPEIGHFADGAALDDVLLALARRERR